MRYGVQTMAGALLGCALLQGPAPARATEPTPEAGAFLAGTGDVPLMAGLHQVPDRGLVFETMHGRIVEVYAVGDLPPERVRSFYRETLPQLGWRAAAGAGDLTFRREGEHLTLSFPSDAEPLTVRFRIAPGP